MKLTGAKFLKAGGLQHLSGLVCFGTRRALPLGTNIGVLTRHKERMNAPYRDFYLRDPDAVRSSFASLFAHDLQQTSSNEEPNRLN